MSTAESTNVSVIIKTLNEEEHIEAAIRSALEAVARVGGEVILADSVSTDNTIAIASKFPIKIVQLKNPAEKRCGIGPQLGYQIAKGKFVYILDGDMELDPDFLPAAIDALEKDSQLGGVAGLIEEVSEASYQFRGRKRRNSGSDPGETGVLEMGGLYRRSAIEDAGHFSDRNLHAYEELDLGYRLTAAGWKLIRLPIKSVVHHGYDEGNWDLLMRRWKSRYLDGGGEIIRGSLGKSHFVSALMSQKHLLLGLAIWFALLVSLLGSEFAKWLLPLTIALVVGLILLRVYRIGNVKDAIFAQVVWQLTSVAMIRGFFARRVPPSEPIDYVDVSPDARI